MVEGLMESVREELYAVLEELTPLENKVERLRKKRDFLQNVLEQAKDVYPEIAEKVNLINDSKWEQYKAGVFITQIPPAIPSARRHSESEVVAACLKVIEELDELNEGVHSVKIAEKLVENGFYPDIRRCLWNIERVLVRRKDAFAKVDRRTYKARGDDSLATIGEVLEQKRMKV